MKEFCPKCAIRFSDWFIWGGFCFCYPCWVDSKHTEVILEKEYRKKYKSRLYQGIRVGRNDNETNNRTH